MCLANHLAHGHRRGWMEYFLLRPFEEGCRFKVINHDKDILICSMTRKGEAPDFTLRPCPLVSDRVKGLLEQYLPSMDFVPCMLEGEEKPGYWAFAPKEQGAENARFGPDGSVLAVRPLGLVPIFTVPNYKKVSYVINLALAESLLRRGFLNLGLERIETLGGGPYGCKYRCEESRDTTCEAG